MSKVYEVEDLISQAKVKNETYFKVKWKGYSYKDCTWEPESSLGDLKAHIKNYSFKSSEISHFMKNRNFEDSSELYKFEKQLLQQIAERADKRQQENTVHEESVSSQMKSPKVVKSKPQIGTTHKAKSSSKVQKTPGKQSQKAERLGSPPSNRKSTGTKQLKQKIQDDMGDSPQNKTPEPLLIAKKKKVVGSEQPTREPADQRDENAKKEKKKSRSRSREKELKYNDIFSENEDQKKKQVSEKEQNNNSEYDSYIGKLGQNNQNERKDKVREEKNKQEEKISQEPQEGQEILGQDKQKVKTKPSQQENDENEKQKQSKKLIPKFLEREKLKKMAMEIEVDKIREAEQVMAKPVITSTSEACYYSIQVIKPQKIKPTEQQEIKKLVKQNEYNNEGEGQGEDIKKKLVERIEVKVTEREKEKEKVKEKEQEKVTQKEKEKEQEIEKKKESSQKENQKEKYQREENLSESQNFEMKKASPAEEETQAKKLHEEIVETAEKQDQKLEDGRIQLLEPKRDVDTLDWGEIQDKMRQVQGVKKKVKKLKSNQDVTNLQKVPSEVDKESQKMKNEGVEEKKEKKEVDEKKRRGRKKGKKQPEQQRGPVDETVVATKNEITEDKPQEQHLAQIVSIFPVYFPEENQVKLMASVRKYEKNRGLCNSTVGVDELKSSEGHLQMVAEYFLRNLRQRGKPQFVVDSIEEQNDVAQ